VRPRQYYALLATISVVGLVWLAFVAQMAGNRASGFGSVCFVKNIYGIPCPSCGITRSILALLTGDVAGALFLNPLGLFAFGVMVLIPFWISIDMLRKDLTLFRTCQKTEAFLRANKTISIALIMLIAANWLWNIQKGL
jgi:hypothetical protein